MTDMPAIDEPIKGGIEPLRDRMIGSASAELSDHPEVSRMQVTTFGSFLAAEVLVAELEALADPAVSRKVSRLLQDFNTGLSHLADIPDPTYRRRLALLWRDDFLNRAAIHPSIDKFVRNVLCTYAKPLLSNEDADSDPAGT
jgi:hypothetical protein